MLFYHHGVADGLSRQALINDLLTAYEELCKDVHFHHKYLPPIPQALDVCFPDGLTVEQNEAVQKFANDLTNTKTSIDLHLKFEKSHHLDVNDRTIFYEGTPETKNHLLAACKKEGVTVGAAAMAASVFAVAKLRKSGLELTILEPVNLRPRFSDTSYREHVGLSLALAFLKNRADSDTKFWDLARSQKDNLNERVEKLLDKNLVLEKSKAPRALICPITKVTFIILQMLFTNPICN